MGALGYGTDLRCASDLLETMDVVDPFSPLAIAEAVVRRLDTPRGGLIDDPNYGLDIRQYLNRGTSIAELLAISSEIRAEVEQDDRIETATIEVTFEGSAALMRVSIRILPVDPTLGAFSMTVTATSAAVVLEAMAA